MLVAPEFAQSSQNTTQRTPARGTPCALWIEVQLDKSRGVTAGRSIAVVGQSPTVPHLVANTAQFSTRQYFRSTAISNEIIHYKEEIEPKVMFRKRQEIETSESVSRGGNPTGG